jgi:hypothetical protein
MCAHGPMCCCCFLVCGLQSGQDWRQWLVVFVVGKVNSIIVRRERRKYACKALFVWAGA